MGAVRVRRAQIRGLNREDGVLVLSQKVREPGSVESDIIIRTGGKSPWRLREHSQTQLRIRAASVGLRRIGLGSIAAMGIRTC